MEPPTGLSSTLSKIFFICVASVDVRPLPSLAEIRVTVVEVVGVVNLAEDMAAVDVFSMRNFSASRNGPCKASPAMATKIPAKVPRRSATAIEKNVCRGRLWYDAQITPSHIDISEKLLRVSLRQFC